MEKIKNLISSFKKYIFVVVLLIILVFIYFYMFETDKEVILEEEKLVLIENEAEVMTNISNKIKVDIKGAVVSPGVYELEIGQRVSDAIEISGGLINTADTSTINLSKNLFDEMVIIVYTKKEIEEIKKGSVTVKYIEKECICPKLENDACIENSEENVQENNTNNSIKKVSLNNATLSELMTLSGIGESKAKAIIEYREKNGFKSIDEITKVSGIGESTYEKIKQYLTL